MVKETLLLSFLEEIIHSNDTVFASISTSNYTSIYYTKQQDCAVYLIPTILLFLGNYSPLNLTKLHIFYKNQLLTRLSNVF